MSEPYKKRKRKQRKPLPHQHVTQHPTVHYYRKRTAEVFPDGRKKRRKKSVRKVGDARVHGTVRGPITLRKMAEQAVERRKRKLVRTLTLKPQREAIGGEVRAAKDVLTGKRLRRKLARIFGLQTRHVDASAPQAEPRCQDHIGKPPLLQHPVNGNGVTRKGYGFCASCQLELKLVRGKIPVHVPGPPPYTHCWHCGGWLHAWYPQLRRKGKPREEWGAYNDVACPNYYREVELESAQRGQIESAPEPQEENEPYAPKAPGRTHWSTHYATVDGPVRPLDLPYAGVRADEWTEDE